MLFQQSYRLDIVLLSLSSRSAVPATLVFIGNVLKRASGVDEAKFEAKFKSSPALAQNASAWGREKLKIRVSLSQIEILQRIMKTFSAYLENIWIEVDDILTNYL